VDGGAAFPIQSTIVHHFRIPPMRRIIILRYLLFYALNTHIVPLGSMKDGQWEDRVVAIDNWFRLGGGFAVDSAERLLQRLTVEHAVLSPHRVSFKAKKIALAELQKVLLHSWIEIHQGNQNSKLALVRAVKALAVLMGKGPKRIRRIPRQ
jgi:hypothetical protein